MSSSISMPS